MTRNIIIPAVTRRADSPASPWHIGQALTGGMTLPAELSISCACQLLLRRLHSERLHF